MTKKLMTARRRAHRAALFTGLALTGMGALHLVKPEPFDHLIPEQLPGTARQWSIGSGFAELGTAALLLIPATRKAGGVAAAALFVGVWPGNFKMAWDWRHASAAKQAISLGRLPLQIPMIMSAVKIAKNA
ncbi:hypothetical protein MHK71_07230 [Kocuria indica]|uniref:DoxX family protein n=1 Tax=Kocuria TaxID=57493 RepID=UPI0009EDC103|nr:MULTISPECIES: hypothetical protein [Kocuria]MCG7432302.1 hypothetical protein [Kocuria indica]